MLNSLFKHWSYKLFTPGKILREKYEALKQLIAFDTVCHEKMAELQDLLHSGRNEDLARIRHRFSHFSSQVEGMIKSLDILAPGRYPSLKNYHRKFDFYVRFLLAPPAVDCSLPFVRFFEDISLENKLIGNKAKHLAAIHNDLGIVVPQGFVVSASAFNYLIEYNNLRERIDYALARLDITSNPSLEQASEYLTGLIKESEVPPDLIQTIDESSAVFYKTEGVRPRVAVRSSAINEDGVCSFAGQYATRLNVEIEGIGSAYLQVLSSKYSPQALFYRISKGMNDEETAMSVLVQEMVPARCSGVLYTSGINEGDADDEYLYLHIIQGLGQSLVDGTTSPDQYRISRSARPEITDRKVKEQVIADAQALSLAELGLRIEKYFGAVQDIEWAIDAADTLYILQARTLHTSPKVTNNGSPVDTEAHPVLAENGEQASGGVAYGEVFQASDRPSIEDIPEKAVLVTRNASPDLVRLLDRFSAVIAERGSRASHFATVAREFRIPFIAGIGDATQRFEAGAIVTVDANSGTVYSGKVEELIDNAPRHEEDRPYHKILSGAMKFISPLELVDPAGKNFTPEGCRSMHDIIRFCHEKALSSMFSAGRPGTGRGSLRLASNIPLDVFLFDVGGGITRENTKAGDVRLSEVSSVPFHALWRGLTHPGVQWKQKPFDWDAYDRIELAGGVPPAKDSFTFASYAVVGNDYLHFNIRFGYHFTIVDVMCGESNAENHCLLRFAGGGGDYEHRSLRIDFLSGVLQRLDFQTEQKGDLLEARIPDTDSDLLIEKLDMLGRLLGATKLMDMVLENSSMVEECVDEFFNGRYSFSEQG